MSRTRVVESLYTLQQFDIFGKRLLGTERNPGTTGHMPTNFSQAYFPYFSEQLCLNFDHR